MVWDRGKEWAILLRFKPGLCTWRPKTSDNILAKLGMDEMARLHFWIADRWFQIVPEPASDERAEWTDAINPKDRHVVRAALSLGCQYVLTFDRPLIAQVNSTSLNLVACLPEELIHHFIRPTPTYKKP
jgi:hypothetical protein